VFLALIVMFINSVACGMINADREAKRQKSGRKKKAFQIDLHILMNAVQAQR
jgi:hypothetical protein